jgi:hypothetical protein
MSDKLEEPKLITKFKKGITLLASDGEVGVQEDDVNELAQAYIELQANHEAEKKEIFEETFQKIKDEIGESACEDCFVDEIDCVPHCTLYKYFDDIITKIKSKMEVKGNERI